MEVKIGNRRLKMIDGKVCIVMFSRLGIDVKSGKFTPVTFNDSDGYNMCSLKVNGRLTTMKEHRIVWKLAHPDWDIFDTSNDNIIDHINRNRKDNRLENLHIVNRKQNSYNRDDKGYTLRPNGKYQASIRVDGLAICLGTFDTEEKAHSAYLQAKLKYHVIV